MAESKRLGDVLLAERIITPAELRQALKVQQERQIRLGEALIELGYATEEDIARALSSQLGFPFLKLRDVQFEEEAVRLLNKSMAERYQVVPIRLKEDGLQLGMADPLNVVAIDDIEFLTNRNVNPVVMTARDMARAVEWVYDTPHFFREQNEQHSLAAVEKLDDDAPVVRLVNSIILQAIEDRASDIHIEPYEDKLLIRYRIDGVLQVMRELELEVHPSLLSRLKIMASLDISERRLPQDGSIRELVGDRLVDMRLSTLPTINGEKAVLRIHNTAENRVGMSQLGMSAEDQESLRDLLRLPHGMILVTGPTGSGKTTTLYACLEFLNDPARNIITIEDPVERRLAGISQVSINPKIGLDYARILRAVLRQDPNVIMVGEIRDPETAEIAIRAAITGHMVLSTLHTSDASSTITRLRDMGILPYLIAAAVSGVLAQRLVRRLCYNCREEYQLPLNHPLVQGLGLERAQQGETEVTLYRAVGCSHCHGTGYRGRTGVFELLPVDDSVRQMIVDGAGTEMIRAYAVEQGMKTLYQDALTKLVAGITTVEEILNGISPQGLKVEVE